MALGCGEVDFVTAKQGMAHVPSMLSGSVHRMAQPGLAGAAMERVPSEIVEHGAPGSVIEIYDQHFHFVWRCLRRLGVVAADLDDAVQDVFVVVHRRLCDFDGYGTVKGWLFAIAFRVSKIYRRRNARRALDVAADDLALSGNLGSPEEARCAMQAAERIQRILEQLDDDKRAVLVMSEFEEMQAPEIAAVLSIPINTVYSRLRLARDAFELALKRQQARDDWRHR